MDKMENQINSILNNPEMMQQIMAMANAMNQQPPEKQEQEQSKQNAPGFSMPDIDPSMLQKLSGLAGQSNIDNNQRTLLKALSPYLNRERISKLEKAMRAAKMANMASTFLGKSSFPFHVGR